jgi:hypothetical protein
MTEVINNVFPPDNINLQYDHFVGTSYVFNNDGSVREIDFTVAQARALDPFKYNKPVVKEGGDPSNPDDIEFVMDKGERVGVRPLQLVRNAKRPPNHLYEIDDAILCAVKNNDTEKWETRYFPKNSLDNKVWQQAMELLGAQNHV